MVPSAGRSSVRSRAQRGPSTPSRASVPLVRVVDDDALSRRLAFGALSRVRHAGCHAPDGEEALGVLAGRPVDLVLLDSDMPNLDGAGLLTRLAAHPRWRHVPVVLMTAMGESETQQYAADPRVRAVLLKTHFSLSELRAQ